MPCMARMPWRAEVADGERAAMPSWALENCTAWTAFATHFTQKRWLDRGCMHQEDAEETYTHTSSPSQNRGLWNQTIAV